MPQDPFIREKFTRLRTAARQLAAEYLERFPKDRYQTEIESWRHLQSDNIEFTLKRLREPIDADNHGGWSAQWETAIELPMLVGEHGGDPMVPRTAKMQALQRESTPATAPRRKRAKVYNVIRWCMTDSPVRPMFGARLDQPHRTTRHAAALFSEPGLARVSRLRPVHQLRLHIFRQVPQGVSLSKGRRFHGRDDGNARLRL
jgi:hypothetical protein